MELSGHGLDYGGMLCSKKLSAQFSNAYIGQHRLKLTTRGPSSIQDLLYEEPTCLLYPDVPLKEALIIGPDRSRGRGQFIEGSSD